ncbi:uncharacterized protein QC761_0028280 [Podospora bellae-mahoneyi]|uniref:Uncharacterized protein n=1 Tax=Podospora bellae-mahoneyi TaxID=2093777 RepID=A0ABR0FV28_9PEZI|nr:hypothetical protein QC761_0028280 [Podospora bellae-mahoneyi]
MRTGRAFDASIPATRCTRAPGTIDVIFFGSGHVGPKLYSAGATKSSPPRVTATKFVLALRPKYNVFLCECPTCNLNLSFQLAPVTDYVF